MPPDKSRVNALINAFYDGWNTHDAAAVARMFTTTGTYLDPTTDRPAAGLDIASVVDPLCGAFPDLAFEHTEPIGGGERYVAEWVMRGHTQTVSRWDQPDRKGGHGARRPRL